MRLFDCKGVKMKYKFVIPYVISLTSLLGILVSPTSQDLLSQGPLPHKDIKLEKTPTFNPISVALNGLWSTYNAETEYHINQMYIDDKANVLVDKYMSNMLNAQERLKPLLGTGKYRAAVRKELPGAPVGLHCVYGQYTQLSRAQKEMDDTITIIPAAGSRACQNFKYEMRRKYNAPEYDGAIAEGKMYQSDSAYNVALDKYMARNRVGRDAPDSVRAPIAAKFAKSNFSAEQLTPGTMLVVPRYRGSKNKFHMIMFLGRGRIENGKFVADDQGKYIYTGHNKETIGYLFDTWDTSNVFAADTKKIARAQYAREWSRIESMSRAELIQFIQNDSILTDADLIAMPREELLRMARARYFNKPMPQKLVIPQRNNALAPYRPAQQQYNNLIMERAMQHTI